MQLTLKVRFAWWLPFYLKGLCFFCALHGRMPDAEKLRAVVIKATTVKVIGK